MAAVPSIGRANQIEGIRAAPEADATHVLYERYANQIFGYCMHQLGSREEAEDAVQSTFLNAFRGLSRGVVPELEQAWLFKIAHNVCLSRRRSSWRRGRIESPEDFQEMQDTLAAPNKRDLRDELAGLQDVLEDMPESQRRAILLREWQGLSYREIAEEMDLSQSAVETLIFRARRTLAQGLQEPPRRTLRNGARRGVDLGGVLGAVKTFFLGGSAVKVGAAVVAVTAATVAASTPPALRHRLRPPTKAAPRVAPLVAKAHSSAAASVSPARHSAPVQHLERAPRTHAAQVAQPVVRSSQPVAEPPVGEESLTSEPVETPQATAPPSPSVAEQAPAAVAPVQPAQATNGNGSANAAKPDHGNGNASATKPDHGNGNGKSGEHGNGQGNSNHDASPAPAPSAAPAGSDHGQGHKNGKHAPDPRVPAVVTAPVSDPAPQPAPTETTTVAASPAPSASGQSEGHGNGGGNGNGNGGGNGRGSHK